MEQKSIMAQQSMKAVRIHQLGGPEVLQYEVPSPSPPLLHPASFFSAKLLPNFYSATYHHLKDVPVPVHKDDEVLVKHAFMGVNFIDIYFRTGLYKTPLPAMLGREAAGTIEKVGAAVKDLKVGDRVAFCLSPTPTYAEFSNVPAWRAVKLPDDIDFATGATLMIQGLTAHYLATSTYPLKPGDTALVLAGAGGVGQLLIQIAKLRGAKVIATVSTNEKAELVRKLGADEVILYTNAKINEEVRRLTNGKGVHVAYDSVGKDTWEQSLNSLAPLGYLVLYGNASGPVPPFDPLVLSEKGSLFVTRATLGNYVATPEAYRARAQDLFNWVSTGKLKVQTEYKFPLSQAAEAHKALESRKTTGKILLFPDK